MIIMPNKPPVLERRAAQSREPIVRPGFGPGQTIGLSAEEYLPGFDSQKHTIEAEGVVRYGFGEEPTRAVRFNPHSVKVILGLDSV